MQEVILASGLSQLRSVRRINTRYECDRGMFRYPRCDYGSQLFLTFDEDRSAAPIAKITS